MKVAAFFCSAALLVATPAFADLVYYAELNGANESPSNPSPGIGFAKVTIDTIAETMRVEITFSGLVGTTTASHIHCCTTLPGTGVTGVATQVPRFIGFPTGVTSGSYDHTFDLTMDSTYNPAFETAHGATAAGAAGALEAGLAADDAYLNIHSISFPGGEIRGFLQPVPEPGELGVLAGALAVLGLVRRLRAS